MTLARVAGFSFRDVITLFEHLAKEPAAPFPEGKDRGPSGVGPRPSETGKSKAARRLGALAD